jgi:CxxC motif-containing protein (DUF1111 family)
MKRSILCVALLALAYVCFAAAGGATAVTSTPAKIPSAARTPTATSTASAVTAPVTMTVKPVPAGAGAYVPLFTSATKLEPPTIIDTPTAIITHVGDRGRDRHAREWWFHNYEHYLPKYWMDRTLSIEIIDTVPKGGKTVTFNIVSLAPLNLKDLRAFYEGKFSVAQYSSNEQAKETSPLHYTATVAMNTKERRPLKVGDRMEIEFSGFIQPPFDGGRTNYYGTTFLYIVGQGGMQPWEWHETIEDAHYWKRAADNAQEANRPITEASLDSFPLPELALSGGMTTGHENCSDEPKSRFDQMATNIAPSNTQPFVLGRRLVHTDFLTGVHSEPDNPIFVEQKGRLGPRYSAPSCATCKAAMPPEPGTPMLKYLVRVAADAKGTPHPKLGSILQPLATGGAAPEGGMTIDHWEFSNGTYADGTSYTLRKPVYKFSGPAPEFYSVRLSISKPAGMGLLEAADENAIAALAARNGGAMNIVADLETGQPRMGRYGYKAGVATLKQQVARRLNDAMSITTSVMPKADSGSEQVTVSAPANRLADADLENITRYYSLRSVPPRRDFRNPQVQKGETLFASSGCVRCHVPSLKTSPYAPMAELRNQTIHPYTDLLLHDMGNGLADTLGEGSASGAQWRTAPLWGEGLVAPATGGEAYLHDGRARDLREAILWHGGDAYNAKEAFRNMPAQDRTALVRFLQSL